MPTDLPSTFRLLVWVAVGLALVGFAYAAKLIVSGRKLARALETQENHSRDNLAKFTAAEHARLALVESISHLQYELEVEKQNGQRLSLRLQQASASSPAGSIRAPSPPAAQVLARPPDTEVEQQAKLRQLEASLEQARLSLEASEQALRQSKLVVQRRQLEISKLASQVDDLALNLEETRILVAEKQREALDAAKREQQAELNLEQLRKNEAYFRQKLEESVGQLKVHREAQGRAEQALQQSQSVIQHSESNSRETAEQLAVVSQQLEERNTAYGTLERMLQDSTASEVQLRRDLKLMTFEREQLEIQNIELKNVLSQMSGGSAIAPPSADVTVQSEPVPWPTVTESDIQGAMKDLRALPSIRVEPYRSIAAVAEVLRPDPEAPGLERELREARLRLQLLESGMGDLEYLREQNAKLREELTQDKGAARELTALQLEHKRAKLDLQLAEQRLATQAASIEDLSNVASELQDHKAELEALRNLRAQIRDLRAENFALRNAASGTYRVAAPAAQLQSDSRELVEPTLDTAVLSDHLGLPVAVTGNLPAESLAAVSGIAAQVASHVRELLPMGPISTVQWTDQYGMTVTCKLFKLAGDEMAMTTLASGNPSEQALKETLKTVLESIGWTEDGPQTDVPNTAVG